MYYLVNGAEKRILAEGDTKREVFDIAKKEGLFDHFYDSDNAPESPAEIAEYDEIHNTHPCFFVEINDDFIRYLHECGVSDSDFFEIDLDEYHDDYLHEDEAEE